MIRRSFVLGTALLLSAPLPAQVGYPPSSSPYEDLRGKQGLSLTLGLLAPGVDPARVGPHQGALVSGRYDLRLTNALWLSTRLGLAPGLERRVKDPLFTGALRDFGTSTDAYVLGDIGFGMNLTGNKSWRRIVPQVHGGVGFVSTVAEPYDLGAYRFGTKFQLSYGIGARLVTRSAWELQADVTHMFWKYKYPGDYGGDGSTTDTSILRDGSLNVWKGNLIFQAGVTRYLFR